MGLSIPLAMDSKDIYELYHSRPPLKKRKINKTLNHIAIKLPCSKE